MCFAYDAVCRTARDEYEVVSFNFVALIVDGTVASLLGIKYTLSLRRLT